MANNNVLAKSVIETTLHGQRVKIEYRIRRNTERYSKARAYVWYPTEQFCGEAPPFSMKGEDPANDKAWRAYNKREVAVMRDILALLGVDTTEWSFSRKAGCGCGCSPGFRRKNHNEANREHFITVSLAD